LPAAGCAVAEKAKRSVINAIILSIVFIIHPELRQSCSQLVIRKSMPGFIKILKIG
jgi:hypothetical protein